MARGDGVWLTDCIRQADMIIYLSNASIVHLLSIDYAAEEFIRTYIKTFDGLASKLRSNDKALFFPSHLASPHNIKCVISSFHGIAFEWSGQSNRWTFEVVSTAKSAEDFVLPHLNGRILFLLVEGEIT
jgi:hypothetical protein